MNIKEISKIAKVSQATVSLALNNRPGVSEETRYKILEIASKYGYSKRSSNPKKNILFIKYIGSGAAVEQNGDFIARVIDSIEYASSNLGYTLIIKNIMETDFKSEIKAIDYDEYAGIVFLGTEAKSEDISSLKDISIPIVAVDNMFQKHDIDSVVMDNFDGIYKAVSYLVSLGHKKIGYLDSVIRFTNFDQRTEAFLKSMEEFGLDKNQMILHVEPNLDGAYQDMLKHLKQVSGDMPTAFVGANDTIVIGAVKALKAYGMKIPNQISVIGFDDIPFCTMMDKPLTTIRVYKERMGELAVKLLDDKINNPSEETVKMLVTTKLIERESTASII
ncbi:MAG: transcriptional regulator, LacI family [Eubacterium sp.]|jgi:LacI family transcriptional regulator|nr:transcriptional regulator, LacI family [Eubacterium sp.]